jgi:hypothetical protein
LIAGTRWVPDTKPDWPTDRRSKYNVDYDSDVLHSDKSRPGFKINLCRNTELWTIGYAFFKDVTVSCSLEIFPVGKYHLEPSA